MVNSFFSFNKINDYKYLINDINVCLINETSKEVPLVSVTMITYNHENFISEAIEGVMMQNVSFNIELVIGEDCSNDRTRDIIKDFQKKYPDKIILKLPNKNLGTNVNSVSNKLLCRGKYIAECEGDDYWIDPNKLQKQVDFLESNSDFVLCASNSKVLKNGVLFDNFSYENKRSLNIKNLLTDNTSNPIPTATVVFLREALNIVNFNFVSECKFGDLPLYIELLNIGKIYFFNDFFSVYRITDTGIHASLTNQEKKKHIIDFYYQVAFNYPEYKNLCIIQIDKVFKELEGCYSKDWEIFFERKIEVVKEYLQTEEYLLRHRSLLNIFKILIYKILISFNLKKLI